ncbi:MAG: FAD-dependent oxidoreductase [Planktomarina sp.]
MKIGIAGAGIGGLAAAALLHDGGHQVTVFDQFDAPKPVGSGLVIQPVGQSVLHRIGVRDAALAAGAPIHRMFGTNARGWRALDVKYGIKGDGVFGLGIHRSGLFDVLFNAVKERGIELVSAFEVTGRNDQILTAADGRTAGPFDLIIDALGSHSALSSLKPKALDYGAVWGTVDWPDTNLPADQLSQKYDGAKHMVGAMPCGHGKAAIFWSLPVASHDDFRAAGLDAWKADANALWPDFKPFTDQITDLDQMTFAAYSHGTIAQAWATGIAHIGDAAHRASPQLGQGANMALLDAAALAWAVGKYEGNAALAAFGKARKRHIATYQGISRVFTPMYQSGSTVLPWIRDYVLFPLSRIPPAPLILTQLVRGQLVWPMRKP